jgi:dipeptidyl aminopeptidase/acylaminoacyl peptidase
MLTHRLVRIGLVPVLVIGVIACSLEPVPPSVSVPVGSPAPPQPDPTSSVEASLPGGTMAFLRDGEMFVRDMESGTETPVGTTNQTPLAFTLDGSALIVLEAIPDDVYNAVLARQPIAGGPSTELATVQPLYGPLSQSPDGRFIGFGSDGAAPNGITVVDLETGEAIQLTEDGGGTPVWSPDSGTIAYESGHDLFVLDLDSRTPRRLTNDEDEDSPYAWTEDGRSVLVTSHRGGDGSRLSITVWQVDVADGALTHRPGLAANASPMSLRSPDGRWDAYFSERGSLLITNPGVKSGTRVARAPEVDHGVHLTWSPNGAWLVWTGFVDGASDLFMVHAPDGEPINLTRSGAPESHPVWGPIRHGF